MYDDMKRLGELVGKTVKEITGGESGSDSMTMVTEDGFYFRLYHSRDCCESVNIEDIAGDVSDLIGSPITMAEEVTSNENPPGFTKEYQESFTWTFYKLATAKGYVTIRWYGESNGYYSESVELDVQEPPKEPVL